MKRNGSKVKRRDFKERKEETVSPGRRRLKSESPDIDRSNESGAIQSGSMMEENYRGRMEVEMEG